MFTTDETNDSYLTAYDISDLTNITELSRFQTDPGSGAVVHNTHIRNDFAITSWYKQGVVITDVSRPRNPIEVGHYDTYPAGNGSGFDGDWGVYPFLPSGNLVVSDMSNGFFVLSPTYIRGCYLEGLVTDSNSAQSLSGVTVTILAANVDRTTDLTGHYYSGTEAAGTYDVQFSKAGYNSKTISGINLANGVLTQLDVQLSCINCVALSGQVIAAGTSNPIVNAQVVFTNGNNTETFTTDALGNFNMPNFNAGTYNIVAGAWGYQTICQSMIIDGTTSPITFTLNEGYYDDFAFDFGWTHTTAPHDWERGEPVGTFNNNDPSNPEDDVNNDCIDQCYVTDNGGGDAFDHDVDPADSTVTLTSPIFDLSTYIDPQITFYRWFYNGELNGNQPNDEMQIKLTNGINTVILENIFPNTAGNGTWVQKSFNVSALLTPTAVMQLSVETFDIMPSSIVEGGLDKFEVTDNGVGVGQIINSSFSAYPNPFTNELMIDASSFAGKNSVVEIYNSVGEKIYSENITTSLLKINSAGWAAGIYVVRMKDGNEVSKNVLLSKVY
jgi:hypothetical protein